MNRFHLGHIESVMDPHGSREREPPLLLPAQTPPQAPRSEFYLRCGRVIRLWFGFRVRTTLLILVKTGPQAPIQPSLGQTGPKTAVATVAQQQEVLLGQSQELSPLVRVLGLVQFLPAPDLQLSLGKV